MSRVYRNISVPVAVFGLELYDLLVLAVFFLVIFNLSDHLLWNIGLMALLYLGFRYFKKGKPQGFVIHLAKFLLNPKNLSVLLEKPTKKTP